LTAGEGDFRTAVYRDSNSELRVDVSPLFLTYFMVDWAELKQEPSETICLTCGAKMMRVEPIKDKKGIAFVGTVCHPCTTVIWSRE
jgi:hypothetical protein